MATPALAGTWETRCKTQSVPYQETVRGGNTGDILGGAIIGGVIGKAATGQDGGAAVGAIIGGAVANENSTRTVTRYKNVETCKQVYVPSQIYDGEALRQSILRLNSGGTESKERIMDVQYTIGVGHDGVWGPRSVMAANAYLDNAPVAPAVDEGKTPLYSLMVNDVIVVSSTDVNSIDEIKEALYRAGVDSIILVNVQ
ncbi:MAG: hypothetical protein KDK00_14850 [Rhodobacteraceae bacterium]|nr:hypothetical protein [Paracoccaceae bacterium]